MKLRIPGAIAVLSLVAAATACESSSSPTDPTPACTFAVTPASATIGAEGGPGSLTVNTASTCTWSVGGAGGWLTVTGSNNGTGTGTVSYSVAANPAQDARSRTLTVGGQNHMVSQQGRTPATCTYEIAPSAADYGKDAAAGSFTVSAPDGCQWTATSDASWLAVTSGQGSGNGSVTYAILRNTDPAERRATIAVADRRFTVRQAGDIGVCQYSVAPVQLSPCMPGGSVTATITAPAGCTWTVGSDASWLGLPGGSSGNGSAVVTISYADNYDAPREGIVMVRWPTPTAGQNVRVSQAGCLYAVSRTAISVAASGGPATFDVFQQAQPNTCGGATQDRCVWSAQSDVPWITVTSSMPRTGDNPVAFTAAANDSATPRVGRIRVRDQVVVVTQAGR